MGGATVLMISGMNLPENVKGIIADCPYSSVRDEIKYTIEKMGIKYWLVAPFVHLAAFIFARFKLCDGEVSKYLKNNKLPVFVIHGSTDDIVPVESSRKLKEKFSDMIHYVEIEGAPHGMSYFVDHDKYISNLDNFLQRIIK